MRILILLAAGLLAGGTALPENLAPETESDNRQVQARAYEENGDIARARQNYGGAEDWYVAALTQQRKNPELYNKLGIVQMKQGEMDAARRSFSEAIKQDRHSAHALNNLGAVYCLQKKYKPALKYLKRALALREDSPSTHLNLAEVWIGLHRIDRAMNEYARALELDPDILDGSENEGLFAQVATPEQRAVIDFLIARAYARRGNMEGALDYLQRAKELHYPKLASVYTESDFTPLWKDPRLAAIVKPQTD